MKIFKNIRFYLLAAIGSQLVALSCTTIDLYEKNVSIPRHRWYSSFRPEFSFTIKDTGSTYQVFLVLRHNEKYNFRNIWINFYYQPPGDTLHKETRELLLATNEKGWLASGMDDIYEHRIQITPEATELKAGNYKFILENIMREDPLLNVMSVGIRVEKKP